MTSTRGAVHPADTDVREQARERFEKGGSVSGVTRRFNLLPSEAREIMPEAFEDTSPDNATGGY